MKDRRGMRSSINKIAARAGRSAGVSENRTEAAAMRKPSSAVVSVRSPAPAPKSNLRPPWQKGESGNPAGYPKKYAQVVKLARAHSPRAIQRLAELIESDDERVALVAAQAVLERGWGKPREFADECEPTYTAQPDASRLSISERRQFFELWERCLSPDPAVREVTRRANLALRQGLDP
jgi:hypothetical protein